MSPSDAKPKKKKSPWLLLKNPWVNLGAVLGGILIGLYAKQAATVMDPVGKLYLSLLKMSVLPIIATAIITSVARLLRSGTANRYLGRIVLVFGLAVVMAATAGAAAGVVGRPGASLDVKARKMLGRIFLQAEEQVTDKEGKAEEKGLWDLLNTMVPSNVFFALSSGQNLAIIFVSILIGIALGMQGLNGSEELITVLSAVYEVFFKILNWALFGLPVGLCCLLAAQVATLGVDIILAMARLVFLFYLACGGLCILYIISFRLVTGLPLLKVLAGIKEPMAISFITTSSVAAIPIAFEHMEEDLKLPHNVTNLVVPLGVVMNRQAYSLLFALATIFIAQLYQIPLGPAEYAIVIVASAISGMAAVGSPAVIAPMIAYVLAPIGLPAAAGAAVLIAISPIIDPLASMTNLFGACASAGLISNASAGDNRSENTQSKLDTHAFVS